MDSEEAGGRKVKVRRIPAIVLSFASRAGAMQRTQVDGESRRDDRMQWKSRCQDKVNPRMTYQPVPMRSGRRCVIVWMASCWWEEGLYVNDVLRIRYYARQWPMTNPIDLDDG